MEVIEMREIVKTRGVCGITKTRETIEAAKAQRGGKKLIINYGAAR